MAKRVAVQVSSELGHWVKTLREQDVTADEQNTWRLVVDVFFDRTQQYAHVITGDMKRSGRSETRIDGLQLVGEVTYGGVMGTQGMVDYVQYELARGGSHDFYRRGMNGMEGLFGQALGEAIRSMMRRVMI